MLKQFEIFEMEPKINALIQKQIEPHISTFYKNQAFLIKLQQEFKNQIKETESVRQKIEPILIDYGEQIILLRNKVDTITEENIKSTEKYQEQICKIENDTQGLAKLTSNMKQEKYESAQEMQDLKIRNENFKQSIEQLLETIHSSQTQTSQDIKTQLRVLDQSFNKLNLNCNDQVNVLKKQQQRVNDFNKQITDIQKDLLSNSNQFEIVQSKFQEQNTRMKQISNKLLNIDQAQNKISQIEYYLAYYLQYHVQNQISDSLFISFPVKFYYKYIQHEKQKFEIFDKQILAAECQTNVQQLIDYHQRIIDDTLQRHKKVQETIKNMESEKNSSSEEKLSVSLKPEKVKKCNGNIQEASRKKQSTNLVYFEEQLRQLREYFEVKLDDIHLQIQQTNNKIKEVSDELYSQQVLFQAEVDKQFRSQSNQTINQIENLQNTVSSLIQRNNSLKYEQIVDQLLQSKQLQTNLSAATLYIVQLLQQDEDDKSGMRLLGGKECNIDEKVLSTAYKSGTMQLSKECLSCSGSPIQLLQFFKVACMNYHPSDILLNGKLVKRQELLERCAHLIQNDQQRKQYQEVQIHIKQAKSKRRSTSIQGQPSFFGYEKADKTHRLQPIKFSD